MATMLSGTEIPSPSLSPLNLLLQARLLVLYHLASSLSSVESSMPTTVLITGGNRGMLLCLLLLVPFSTFSQDLAKGL
jgi:hypothetical protein